MKFDLRHTYEIGVCVHLYMGCRSVCVCVCVCVCMLVRACVFAYLYSHNMKSTKLIIYTSEVAPWIFDY